MKLLSRASTTMLVRWFVCLLLSTPFISEGLAQGMGSANISGTAIANPRDASSALLPGDRLVLVVVDRSRDGFAASVDGSIAGGSMISNHLGDPDDVIVAFNHSAALVLNVLHQIPGMATITLGEGIDPGDPFAVVYFNTLLSNARTLPADTAYEIATHSSWKVPAPGASLEFRSQSQEGRLLQLSDTSPSYQTAEAVDSVSYSQWVASHFGSDDVVNAMPLSDPDNDEMSNAMEYAFDMDPHQSDANGYPWVQLFEDSSGSTKLSLSYPQIVAHIDATIHVEASKDLKSWSGGSEAIEFVSAEIDGDLLVLTLQTVASANPLFIRVRVILSPESP